MMIRLNTLRRRFCAHAGGALAVEFALLAPIILFMLAAVVDFGLWINARSRLEAALSSAATHVMASGQQVPVAALPELGQVAVGILAQQAGEAATIGVTVDNAMTYSFADGGYGSAGNENGLGQCYCPSRQSGGIEWGNVQVCGAPCPGNSALAGRYMSVAVSVPYASIFGGYGLVRNDRVSIEALVNYR